MTDRRVTHGDTRGGARPCLYRIWDGMRRRCHRVGDPAYAYYGARGIVVCTRWRDSYAAFKADVGDRPSAEHQLDRIDNDRGYEPGNVRWVTSIVNMRNRTCTRRVTAWGETKTLMEWVQDQRCTTSYHVLRRRLDKQGLPPEEAISRPLRASWAKTPRTRTPQ